jgi:hypothetical protein
MYYRDLLLEVAKSGNSGDAHAAMLCSGRFNPPFGNECFHSRFSVTLEEV